MKIQLGRLVLISSLVFFSHGGRAVADVPLITVTGTGSRRETNEMRGFTFDVAHQLTVTGLGKIDGNNNGLLDDPVAPQVGLWNSASSELVATAVLDDSAVLRDGMFVTSIDAVTLPAGNYTLAVQWFNEHEPYIHTADYESPAVISNLRPIRQAGSDFRLPTRRSVLGGFGPNLLIEQPLVALQQPTSYTVQQRRDDNTGAIRFGGNFDDARLQAVEVRAIPMDGDLTAATPWQTASLDGSQFSGQLELPAAGWYQIEARGVSDNQPVDGMSVSKIGVGEVFVIAGQSNSANFGSPRLVPTEDRVSSADARGVWRHAADPQPIANGTGGSPWPVLGDLLVQELDMPVGFMSVGWGGTTVGQWVPGASGPDSAPLYNRLRDALEFLGPDGARAVLWHQGESDAFRGTSQQEYFDRLRQVIEQSRTDAGYDVPWGIAQAAFLPNNTSEANAEIIAGQLQVIESDPSVFAGPSTEDLLGPEWRYDQVHFNEAGLRVHAQRWFDSLVPHIVPEPVAGLSTVVWTLIALSALRRSKK